MAIRETIATFLARASDVVFSGRSAARIVLGTDRLDERASGFGDESEDAQEGSAAIDMVVGFLTGNVDYENDKSRIYVAQRTNPDEYFQMEMEPAEEEAAAVVIVSDHLYLKARKSIKIRNPEVTILIDVDGNIEIEASKNTTIKSGESFLVMQDDGDINIGADPDGGAGRRILTEEDLCVGIDPTTGAPIISKFVDAPGQDALQGGLVNNGKVKVVI